MRMELSVKYDFNLIIEIDENQHTITNNSYKCELKRIFDLHADLGGINPLYVIRFNPDKYDNHCGIFKPHRNEINKNEFERRKKKLIDTISECLNIKEHKSLLPQFIHLYYNNNYEVTLNDIEEYYNNYIKSLR